MKKISVGFILLISMTTHAYDDETQAEQTLPTPQTITSDNISDHCVKSISHLYRFYFHEIYPNPKIAACNPSETLGPQETAQMQAIAQDLKQNCPAELVSKVRQSFRVLKQEQSAS